MPTQPELQPMSDSELRRWITGTTDWRVDRQAADRILSMPQEVFDEVERRESDLAAWRRIFAELPEGSDEWRQAVDWYIDCFKEWLTAR